MERYCLRRANMSRAIVSVCPLLAIMAPAPWLEVQEPTLQHPSVVGGNFRGQCEPSLTVVALDGERVSLANYQGKPLLVNFRATWCASCRAKMPWLKTLRDVYAGCGLEIIGVITDSATDAKVRQIASKYGVEYRVARCDHRINQLPGILPFLPDSFHINSKGDVVLVEADASCNEEFEAAIRKVLGLGVT